jgi:uncharacterized protein (TIGR02246 family)
MTKSLRAALIMLVAFSGGCASGPGGAARTAQDATDGGERMMKSLEAAFTAGDAQAVAALFADDAVLMASGTPDETGIEEIRKSYVELFANYTIQLRAVPVETKTFGDYGFSRGTYTATMTPKAGGAPIVGDGRFLAVMQRQPDGTWKSLREMSNSDKP